MDPGLSVDQWLSFGIFEMISLLCKINLVQPMPAPLPLFPCDQRYNVPISPDYDSARVALLGPTRVL